MSPQPRGALWVRTVLVAGSAALVITVAIGCSSSKAKPTAPAASASASASTTAAYSVTYSATDTSGGDLGLPFHTIQVLTDGGAKVRITPDDGSGYYEVTDGVNAMVPNTSGDDFDGFQQAKPSDIGRFVVHDSDHTLSLWCANAKESATANVLNRATRHYTCTPVNPDSNPTMFLADEIWVDKESGLILQWWQGPLRFTATQINLHATLPTNAFAMPTAPASSTATAPTIPTFQIPLVGGGNLTDTTYKGAAVVFLAGDANTIRALTARLLPLTGGGTAPRVIGLWRYDDFTGLQGSMLNAADVAAWAKQISAKAGKFDVPVGIDFKGNVAGQMTGDFDPANRQAVVILTDANRTGIKILPATASDADLISAIKNLH
jgi:hypothetical protein